MNGGRLTAGALRAALAHAHPDDIIAVQLRRRGDRISWTDMVIGNQVPKLALLTGFIQWPQASDTIAEPIGTDPMTESTVSVYVLDAFLGDADLSPASERKRAEPEASE